MTSESHQQNKQDLVIRICAILIFGPSLFIMVTLLFFPQKSSTILDFGWVLLLLGTTFLAFSTTKNFIDTIGMNAKKVVSTEADMGIISTGLALVSPLALLSYYFYGVVILSAIIFFAKIFIFKDRA
jgi:hypothetical protein